MNSRDRYTEKVIEMVIDKELILNIFVPKGDNRFVTEDYYTNELMGVRFNNPLAFFNGPNWYEISVRIRNKYGVSDGDQLGEIKEQLREYFIENH